LFEATAICPRELRQNRRTSGINWLSQGEPRVGVAKSRTPSGPFLPDSFFEEAFDSVSDRLAKFSPEEEALLHRGRLAAAIPYPSTVPSRSRRAMTESDQDVRRDADETP
jgi:hypothetical protein